MGKTIDLRRPRRMGLAAGLLALWLVTVCWPARGANTGVTELLKIQGSGASLAFGDYVTQATALDTYHSVFFEVPVGLSQFQVDLFDADILNGDAAGVVRDRARGGGTTVQYRLYDPNGTLVATLDCNASPACVDNAWTTLASFPQTGPGANYVLDQFGAIAYDNNDGTVNWSTNWVETNDDGQPDSGEIQIYLTAGDVLGISDNGGAPSTITRSVDLSPSGNDFSGATLSFDFFTTVEVDGNDTMAVEVSSDGTSWTRLEAFVGEFTAVESRSYDIGTFISANTSVRFIRVQNYGGANEIFAVDNLRIEDAGAPLPFDAGHWELQIDQSSAVTAGDDINGLGIRVHDGDPSAGGTEINAYLESFAGYGSNSSDNARNYRHYPYVTSGCDFDIHDFDWDDLGSVQATSPSVAFSQTGTISGNDVWATNNIAGFTSLARADEYGLWELLSQIVGPTATGGNYATLYAADFNSPGTPPTSQPEPTAYRIYLAADGVDGDTEGSSPGKFRLSQILTFSSGTNPPSPGNPGRYGITLIAENPASAAGSITFDAGNLIVANVPGGDVTYVAGSAQTDTGTVALNGSDLEWNPGLLAPGDVATMAYLVEVVDNGAASILVTGSPGANGTRASFTDETGEANLEWSDGLCGLSVDLQNPTAVSLRSFETFLEDGSVVVEWVTDAEAGTVGFDLWRLDTGRRDFVQVNDRPLTALLSAPQGGVYRFRDELAPTQGQLTYTLVESESLGRNRVYGPFTGSVDWRRSSEVTATSRPDPPRPGDPGARAGRFPVDARFVKNAHVASTPANARSRVTNGRSSSERSAGPIVALKIAVDEAGLYRVEADQMAAGLGVSTAEILARLSSGGLVLSLGGAPVTWLASTDGLGLEFYGEASSNPYLAHNIYRLRLSDALERPSIAGNRQRRVLGGPVPVAAASTFRERQRIEEDLFPVLALPLPEGADFWFWDYLRFGDPDHQNKSFDFELSGVAAASNSQGALTVHLQGGSQGRHELDLYLNGTWIGFATVDDLESGSYTSRFFSQRLLRSGANTLEVESVAGGLFLVDAFEVEFDRDYVAGGPGSLHHRADDSPEVTVRGFSSPEIQVLELADPRHPRPIQVSVTQAADGTYSVSYGAKSGETLYLAVERAGTRQPVSLVPDRASDLRTPRLAADYVIVTTAEMMETAGSLASYRATQGHRVLVVDVVDVFDEFAFGAPDPWAIREFLTYAYENWATPPAYVLLAGNGTWDYRDLQGFGDNLVPPLLRTASLDAPGLYASDHPFGDLVGDDGVWEIAVGRLPVTGAAELQAYIDKVMAYEGDFDGGPRDRFLSLTDNPDSAGDYLADGEALAQLIDPGIERQFIGLGLQDVESARTDLFEALDAGVPLMSYHGHAGMTSLAHEGLMTLADVAALDNQGRSPIVNAVTCFVASFANPGFDSLGEGLVLHPDGGAVALWSSVYFSSNFQTRLLADRFFRQVFHQDDVVLGDAVIGALRAASSHVSRATLRRTAILGDPALRFQHQAVSVPPETSPGE